MATKLQPVPSISTPLVRRIPGKDSAVDPIAVSHIWYNWFIQLKNSLDKSLGSGYTGVIVTAKLTALGTQGSMTFVNGILTAQVAAT